MLWKQWGWSGRHGQRGKEQGACDAHGADTNHVQSSWVPAWAWPRLHCCSLLVRQESDTLLKLAILDGSPRKAPGIWYNYGSIPLPPIVGAVEMQCHIVLLTESSIYLSCNWNIIPKWFFSHNFWSSLPWPKQTAWQLGLSEHPMSKEVNESVNT